MPRQEDTGTRYVIKSYIPGAPSYLYLARVPQELSGAICMLIFSFDENPAVAIRTTKLNITGRLTGH